MEDWKGILQLGCTVITIGFFSTGVLTCIKIKNQRSVGDINALPFVMTSLNCLLWFGYGVLVSDTTLCLVNGTGAFLQSIYMMVYFKYLDDQILKKQYMQIVGGAVLVLASISIFVTYKSQYSNQKDNLGLICDVVTILMFASPLSTLGKVIRTKDTSSLSFPLSFMVVLVSLSWFSYGVVLGDLYVKVPNFIGAALGIFQVSLFFVYPSSSPERKTASL